MLFISFYTKDTGYETEVKNLIKSLDKFNLQYDIVGIDNLGSWDKNCQYKPTFIKNMLLKHKDIDKVVWVDADAVICSYPKLFEQIDCDIAFHYCKIPGPPPQLLTGTMLFKNNNRIIQLLEAWEISCKNNPDIWEQKALQKIIDNFNLDIYHLPSSYVKIFDLDEIGEKNIVPVIEHFQANRKYKKEI